MDLDTIKIQTVFLSTSSTSFEEFFKEISYDNLIKYFDKKNVSQLLIKENRGGSWLYDFKEKQVMRHLLISERLFILWE